MAWLWKSKKTLPPLRFSSDLVHEAEAFQQAYQSILVFCGYQNPTDPPTRLLLARDIERFGVVNFAFESAFLYFSDEHFSDEQIRPEILELALATTHAKITFLRAYSIFDAKSIPEHRLPSKGLMLIAVYLHNLWVLLSRLPEDQKGISAKDMDNWVVPMQDFCSILEKPEMALSLEDNLVAQQLMLHFLLISCDKPLNQTAVIPFAESLNLFAKIRQDHPTIAIFLEQLFKYIPLSYFWFLSKAPYHLPARLSSWSNKCMILFTRRALPLLMSLADQLVFSVFQKQKLNIPAAQHTEIIYSTFKLAALEELRSIFAHFQEDVGINKYFTIFRLLFYFYLVQSQHLKGLEQLVRYAKEIEALEKLDQEKSVLSLRAKASLSGFMDDCAMETSVLPVSIANKRDELFQSVEKMVNSLVDHGFSRRCQRLANQLFQNRPAEFHSAKETNEAKEE